MTKKVFLICLCGALLIAISFFVSSFLVCDTQNVAHADDYIANCDYTDCKNYNNTGGSTQPIWPYKGILQYDIQGELSTNHAEYTWQKSPFLHRSVKDMSGEVPVDIKASGSDFPKEDVLEGLERAKRRNITITSDYGGCGPIAVIGILDYFARTYGYKEIMNDPNDRENRIALAERVFLSVSTLDFGEKGTMIFPSSIVEAFKKFRQQFNLGLFAYSTTSLIGTKKEFFIEKIKEQIDAGIPLTLCVGATNPNKGSYAGHCVTVFSYETWVGTNKATGERVFHTMFGTRLNGGGNEIFYATEDLLGQSLIGLVWYSIPYQHNQNVKASDFATAFVNSNGQGQYFNTENEAEITLSNGYKFNTTRLRCSYIENQYLVMSGIRKSNDALYKGDAYLEFHMNDNIKMIEFDIGLWSNKEGFLNSENETVTVECLVNGKWVKRKVFKPSDLSVLKDSPLRHRVYLKEGTAFRFVVNITPKASDRNKGRVILDNISLYYH